MKRFALKVVAPIAFATLALTLIPSEASAWYCRAFGDGGSGWGRSDVLQRARDMALDRCSRVAGRCHIRISPACPGGWVGGDGRRDRGKGHPGRDHHPGKGHPKGHPGKEHHGKEHHGKGHPKGHPGRGHPKGHPGKGHPGKGHSGKKHH